MNDRVLVCLALLLLLTTAGRAQQDAAPSTAKDHVAAIKQTLQASMAALRQYQWVETSTVTIKDEEKSRKQERCQYGTDGQVVKTPLGGEDEGEGGKHRGLRGRVAKKKRKKISASMEEALALVKQYVPPDPARIESAKQGGRVLVQPPDADGNIEIDVADYLKPGDLLTIGLNPALDHLTEMTIKSYTESEKEAVKLKVGFGTLPDGTIHPAEIHLRVEEQQLKVDIKNSDYTKLGG
jgi:hypothetical protein